MCGGTRKYRSMTVASSVFNVMKMVQQYPFQKIKIVSIAVSVMTVENMADDTANIFCILSDRLFSSRFCSFAFGK